MSGCLFAIVLVAALGRSKSFSILGLPKIGDNPNNFYLWATNLSYGYAFTYDPHAADEWLFESGAIASNHGLVFRLATRLEMPSNAPSLGPVSRPH